jgi:pyruvate dehydrogenase E1 component alpha subunit
MRTMMSLRAKEIVEMEFDGAKQREAYRRMLRIRRFDEEGTLLFKAGKIPGAFHASIGQEATIVGACMALGEKDSMTGTHRSHGHPLALAWHWVRRTP